MEFLIFHASENDDMKDRHDRNPATSPGPVHIGPRFLSPGPDWAQSEPKMDPKGQDLFGFEFAYQHWEKNQNHNHLQHVQYWLEPMFNLPVQ